MLDHDLSETIPATAQRMWLFWDGECGLCQRAIAWVKRHDAAGQIYPVAYQDAPRLPMTDHLARRCERAVHVLTSEGKILSAGRASVYVLTQIGYPRLGRIGSLPPFIWIVELGYWLVARNRHVFSRWLFRT